MKEKKASIIVKMNQPNLLGKMNPKCVLFYIYPVIGLKITQIGLF